MTTVKFEPVPSEDRINGRNSNVYNAATGHPTSEEKKAFIKKLGDAAKPICQKYNVPASVLVAQACLESGYGFTKTAYFANNFFGQKEWAPKNKAKSFQLVGQPDEAFDDAPGTMVIVENLGKDRVIFKEELRVDNWYYKHDSFEASILSMVKDWIVDGIYNKKKLADLPAKYKTLVANTTLRDAAGQFAWELGNRGYCHLGGDYYRESILKLIDQHDLTNLDVVATPVPNPAPQPSTSLKIESAILYTCPICGVKFHGPTGAKRCPYCV